MKVIFTIFVLGILFPFIYLLSLTMEHTSFQTLLHYVPAGRVVVLDLFAEMKLICELNL
ncbi:hypothetical protein RchiOBHm_Chr2g0141841 [Rosa chinensis]|uniref:Uncharacterized protein n=1 Tax=Rosa chinensis TaxID=74649 RepID=A0A2P6RXN8_ROSCH|nr:hypothetical protein RchiOBHm_Chr3g0494761 [Rosa chinensis]PRQ51209.1 hypothetical protein RchiOBHm_Chr2g0141841 [Rosa chinensis]